MVGIVISHDPQPPAKNIWARPVPHEIPHGRKRRNIGKIHIFYLGIKNTPYFPPSKAEDRMGVVLVSPQNDVQTRVVFRPEKQITSYLVLRDVQTKTIQDVSENGFDVVPQKYVKIPVVRILNVAIQ